MKDKNKIVCDGCNCEFEPKQIAFKQTQATVEDKTFDTVYYNCPVCAKAYVVCMLDYWGKKLQDQYIKATESYRYAYKTNLNSAKLQQKLEKVETLKMKAMAYQDEILHKYRDLLPEEILL